MKKMSRILAIVLSLVLCLGLLATTGYAAEAEKDGLKLTLTTDKAEYTEGEQVVATLKVENISGVAMNGVAMEIKAPEAFTAAGAATKTVDTLAAGASANLEVTYQLPTNPGTGDSSSILLVCAIALVSCLAMIGLTWNRKSAAMVLAVMMVLGLAMIGVPANAAAVAAEVSTTITVDGNECTLTASVAAEAEEPAAPADKMVLDFEDGSVGNKYANSAWSEKVYGENGWASVSAVEMNCRNNKVGVDGTTTKFVNFVSDTTPRMYTYTMSRTMTVNKISLDLGNWYNPQKTIDFKASLIDANGDVHYLVGSADTWETFPVVDFMHFDYELTTPVENVVSFVVTTKGVTSGGSYQYLYCDNIIFEGKFAEVIAPTKVMLDFEDGTIQTNYVNTAWKQEYWDVDWKEATSAKMNCRSNPQDSNDKVVNFSADSYSRRYTYSIGATLPSVSYVSIDLGNYYKDAAKTIKYKIILIDEANVSHYLVGDSGTFAELEYTAGGGLTQVEFNLDTPITNVTAIRIVTNCSGVYNWLYVDDIIIE